MSGVVVGVDRLLLHRLLRDGRGIRFRFLGLWLPTGIVLLVVCLGFEFGPSSGIA